VSVSVGVIVIGFFKRLLKPITITTTLTLTRGTAQPVALRRDRRQAG